MFLYSTLYSIRGFCHIWLGFNWTKESHHELVKSTSLMKLLLFNTGWIEKKVFENAVRSAMFCCSKLCIWFGLVGYFHSKICNFNDFYMQFELNLLNGTLWLYKQMLRMRALLHQLGIGNYGTLQNKQKSYNTILEVFGLVVDLLTVEMFLMHIQF